MIMEIEENYYEGEFSLFHRETGQKRIFAFYYSNHPAKRRTVVYSKGRPFLDVSNIEGLMGSQRSLIRLMHNPLKDMLINLRIEKEECSDYAVQFFKDLDIALDFKVEDSYEIEVESSEKLGVLQLFEDTQ